LPAIPDEKTARALVDALRDAGVLPVALAYGSTENGKLAEALGLPLLAKFRAQYEPATAAAGDSPVGAATAASSSRGKKPQEQELAAVAAPTPVAAAQPGLMQTTPVRSGQQVYADNRDLTVLGTVGAGAEVIADGS